MVDVTEAVCPETKVTFKTVSLSRRTDVCHMEEMNRDLLTQLNGTIHISVYFYMLLEDNTDASDSLM
jgi:hypothetical protein